MGMGSAPEQPDQDQGGRDPQAHERPVRETPEDWAARTWAAFEDFSRRMARETSESRERRPR